MDDFLCSTATYWHRWELQFVTSVSRPVFVSLPHMLVSLWFSCTEIHSRVLFCQSRQFQIHHAFRIISADFKPPLKGFCLMSTSITVAQTHPHKWFSSLLSDPVHSTAVKAEPRSSTGQSQSFSRLFHNCAFNGLHFLTLQACKEKVGEFFRIN